MGSTTIAPKVIKNPDGTTTEQAGRTYSSPIYALIDQNFDKQGNLKGRASGGGITKAFSGIAKPSASATIKAPEPPVKKESDETQDTKQNFEDVRTNLLAKAKERRSKLAEMKQEVASKLAMPTPDAGLDKFSIENYRAGGAAFDRDDTESVGDDMATGKPSTSERTKSFLSGMTGNSPLQFMVRGG